MAISIQNLLEGQPELVTTELGASLQEVMAIMLERGFSQLPIVEDGKPVGMVTSDSIGQALLHMKTRLEDLKVIDAKTAFKAVSGEDDLFSVLDDILRSAAVCVVDSDGKLQGILTAYDTTQHLRIRSEDFILVEDIEANLKDCLRHVCNGSSGEDSQLMKEMVAKVGPRDSTKKELLRDKLGELKNEGVELLTGEQIDAFVEAIYPTKPNARPIGFEEFSLGQYIVMAGKSEIWPRLEAMFGIKKDTFNRLLDPVRDTRNDLAHFRGDTAPLDRNRLRYCADWFESHTVSTPPEAPLANVTETFPVFNDDHVEIEIIEHGHVNASDGENDDEDNNGDDNIFEGKYAPLARFLYEQKLEVTQVVLSFEQIEARIGDSLPDTAREHRSWWANDSVGHVQSRQWLAANWRVANVNTREGKVVFERMEREEKLAIALISNVRAALETKAHFPLADSVQKHRLETTLAWYELGDNGRADLSMRYGSDRFIRFKWFINARDKQLNDSIRANLAILQSPSEGHLKQKFVIERLASPPNSAGREGSDPFRVTLAIPNAAPQRTEDSSIEKIVDTVIEFHDMLLPLIQKTRTRPQGDVTGADNA